MSLFSFVLLIWRGSALAVSKNKHTVCCMCVLCKYGVVYLCMLCMWILNMCRYENNECCDNDFGNTNK